MGYIEKQSGQNLTGLDLLRVPFPDNQISKLPKPTKAQNECDYREKVRCKICGGFHHPDVIHLDYVGHAALTDRLLDVDPNWNWEPLSFNEQGLPAFDRINGLWIKLTVCGQTRLGYGSPDGKTGGNAIKECIGDALRNAAMRFGAALDLWHKGDLHEIEHKDPAPKKEKLEGEKPKKARLPLLNESHKYFKTICDALKEGKTTVILLLEKYTIEDPVRIILQKIEDNYKQSKKK